MPDNPEEKLLILQLSEDCRKIARLLSNETSIKILKLLDKRSMSAGDLADELQVRLNTLKYNLDSLLEAGLIRVRQIKWSRKGREIKIYEAVKKVIILLQYFTNWIRKSSSFIPISKYFSVKCLKS